MVIAIKRQRHQAVSNHFEHLSGVAKMESGFRQDCLTGKQRLSYLASHTHGPFVVRVPATREGHEESGIRNTFHDLENPLRLERSRGRPWILPASRMNFVDAESLDRARSRCCRTSCPCGIPVRAEVSSSHVARFFGRRTVSVSPIWQNCTHSPT